MRKMKQQGWMPLDENFLKHPKVVRLERLAPSRGIHLWLGLRSYCRDQRTDGRVPLDMLRVIDGPCWRWKRPTLEALIEVGLVERLNDDEIRLHDYLDWNPSRAQLEKNNVPFSSPAEGGRIPGGDHEEATRSSRGDEEEATRSSRGQHLESSKVDDLDGPPASASRVELEESKKRDPSLTLPMHVCVPQNEVRPATVKKKSGRASPTGSRLSKTQCDPGFEPTPDVQALALRLGFAVRHEQRVRASFVDYWRGRGQAMADWQATYRNWLRREAEKLGLKPPPPLMRQGEFVDAPKREPKRAEPKLVPPPPGYQSAKAGLFRGAGVA